jgi:uncharacterized membrane protein
VKPINRYLVIAATVLAVAGGVFLPSGEGHGWWDSVPLFWSLFGFVGCVVIIYVSKWLGTVLLQKKEEYYD